MVLSGDWKIAPLIGTGGTGGSNVQLGGEKTKKKKRKLQNRNSFTQKKRRKKKSHSSSESSGSFGLYTLIKVISRSGGK